MDLRLERLSRFTDSPDFPEYLDKYLRFVKEKVESEIAVYPYGDMASMGLPGRVTDTLRKAWRVWSFVIKDRRGKGDFEEELDDLVAYTTYLWVYHRMLKEGK